jgi:hypothetical protein
MRNSSLELDVIRVEIDIDPERSIEFGIDSDRMRPAMVGGIEKLQGSGVSV